MTLSKAPTIDETSDSADKSTWKVLSTHSLRPPEQMITFNRQIKVKQNHKTLFPIIGLIKFRPLVVERVN